MQGQSSDTDPHDLGSSEETESIVIVPPPPDGGGRTSRTPAIAGYQLLRQLGRGGMAEVFEAMDLRLGRRVALKLLATSRTDDPHWLARFRTEAAAFARLQHPNVVQIHEVGESAGRPFLSLELVTGGSLAERLRRGPLDPHEAARVARDLARAAHAVHEANVVHRDLKPANVLVAGRSEDTGDHLYCKIADFGLAQLLGGEAGLTETGAMLGTPSYMSPEQAMESRTIGPAADVYALGAILYECLTGRPPFRAATTLETLELVRTAEPVPVRRLQPGVPRDLETIALTCLRKEPEGRYGSAADLTEDLGRFLRSEPIAARPTGALERSIKWCRRRPAVTLLLVMTVLAAGVGVAGLLAHDASLRAALARTAAEKERADSNYREARAAFRQMLGRFEDRRYSEIPRAVELRNAQYEDALKFFAVIVDRQNDSDPDVRLDVAKTRLEVAKLQRALSRSAEADANIRIALALFTELAEGNPRRPEFDAGRAECLANLGIWLASDRKADGGLLGEAAAVYDRLLAADPTSVEYRDGRAGVYSAQAGVHFGRKDWPAVKDCLHREERLREALAAERPSSRTILALARARSSLGLAYQMTGPHDLIEKYYRLALESFEQALRDDPHDASSAIALAQLRVNWAYVLLQAKKYDEALADIEKNFPMLEPLHRLEPQSATICRALMNTHGIRATILEPMGRLLECAQAYERSVAFADPPRRMGGRCELAQLWAQAGEHGKAAELTAAIATEASSPVVSGFTHLVHAMSGAITAAERDPALAGSERVKTIEKYSQLGAAVLSRARRELGDSWPKLWQQFQNDSTIRPLLQRPEVQAALKD